MENEIISQNEMPWNQKQIGLITRTVARGATPDELGLFLYTAKRTGLDPLTRQIYFVKRKVWNKEKNTYDEVGTIQTGIDGYRVIAERSGTLAGIDDAVFDTETEAHPNKATVTVWRIVAGQRVSFTSSARWSEYAQMKDEYVDGKKTGNQVPGGMWAKMPYLMLAKCAESLALRKAFPNDLSGLYTNEEMQQAQSKITNVDPDEEVTDTVAEEVSQVTKDMASG